MLPCVKKKAAAVVSAAQCDPEEQHRRERQKNSLRFQFPEMELCQEAESSPSTMCQIKDGALVCSEKSEGGNKVQTNTGEYDCVLLHGWQQADTEVAWGRCLGPARLSPSTRGNVQCLTATVKSSLTNELNLYSFTHVMSHSLCVCIYMHTHTHCLVAGKILSSQPAKLLIEVC